MSDSSLARYARAIEERWSEFLGRPAVLSPGDWRWITEWHGRGIPLELILECVEDAAERRREGRGAKRPRSLSYLAPAVQESWSVILDGQAAPAAPSSAAPTVEPLGAWRRRWEQEPDGSHLGRLLGRLLADLKAGADPLRIDAALEEALAESVPEEVRAAAEREARSWIAAHASRMSEQEFERAVERAVTVRLRRRLQLPRL